MCIDQMDMDHEVDVFHAVKLIRINRPQLIDMKVGLSSLFMSAHPYCTWQPIAAHQSRLVFVSVDCELQ